MSATKGSNPRSGFFVAFNDRVRRATAAHDEGMTIIEILVAFTLMAIVTLGTVPLFISGLRGTYVARLDTAAKNLTQERFELMRNLPFHVDVTSTPVPASCSNPDVTSTAGGCDFRDILDTYYRSTTAAPSSTTSGFVAANNTLRAPEEPPTGAFYRFAINPVPGFDGRYSQVVATQFLNLDRIPVTPPSNYNSQVAGQDSPASKFLGVTVISRWTAAGAAKTLANFSQIADGIALPPKITTQARAVAVSLSTTLNGARALSLQAGISSSDGASSSGTNAATGAQSLFARINPGNSIEGILASFTAPDNTASTSGSTAPQTLSEGGTLVAESIGGAVGNVNATTALGLPKVGTPSLPSTGQVVKSTAGGAISFRLNNVLAGDVVTPTMVGVVQDPFTYKIQVNEDTLANFPARGTTYLDAASGSSHFAESNASAHTQTIKILETTFAPDGIVQARLDSSGLKCRSTGAALTVEAAFSGLVRYLKATEVAGVNSYVTVPITKPATGPATETLDPAILSDPASVIWTSATTQSPLSDYIGTWGSLVTASVATNGPQKSITASMNGIISMTTQPIRQGDPTSTIGIELGVLSCHAQDAR